MAEIWTPIASPPQIDLETEALIRAQILKDGVINTGLTALEELQDREQRFGTYLDSLGSDLNVISTEGFWPERTLKIGAGLAWLAYRRTGYFQSIDDHLETGQIFAMLDGIPEAYLTSLACDQALNSLTGLAIKAPDFRAPDTSGYQQILDIGAGCTRFYLQSALAS